MSDKTKQVDRPDLTGRVAIVTGASQGRRSASNALTNAGLGYEIALGLAASNARVVIVSRKADEAHQAIAEIEKDVQEETGKKPELTFVRCDLSDLRETRKVAEELAKKEKRLDIAVLNAGVGVEPVKKVAGGYTEHLVVNILSQLLLINHLLPNMRETLDKNNTLPTSLRIVFQSSSLHNAAKLASPKFASLEEYKEDHDPTVSYGISKLAQILAARKIVQAAGLGVSGTHGIRVLATNPAANRTAQMEGWQHSYPLVGKILGPVVTALARTPDRGALAALWAATSPAVDERELQSIYLDDADMVGGTASEDNEETAENFWRTSQEIIKEQAVRSFSARSLTR